MKRSLFAATVSAVSLSLAMAGTALADDDSGWYLRGNVGVGAHTETDLTGGLSSRVHEDTGMQSRANLAYSLGLGYDFGNNWRLELDGDQLFTETGAISNTPNSDSKLRTTSLMLNALYDFNTSSAFTPYVGAGAGFVRGEGSYAASDLIANGLAIAHPACTAPRGTQGDGTLAGVATCNINGDEDTAFGWQVLAGVGLDITDNLVWDTHATYQDAGSFDFDGASTVISNTGATTVTPLSSELSGAGLVSLMTGIRYRFGGATPPPPPPPPPPPGWSRSPRWSGSGSSA
ncbi:MAG: acyloxyacyl hydrolase [Pseudomonadota bacterium]